MTRSSAYRVLTAVLLCSFLTSLTAQAQRRRAAPKVTMERFGPSMDTSRPTPRQKNIPAVPEERVIIDTLIVQETESVDTSRVMSDTTAVETDSTAEVSVEEISEADVTDVEAEEKISRLKEALQAATHSSIKTRNINKPSVTEAYPFVSADGLRLYFSSNREGGHARLYISERASVNEAFGLPKVLSPHLPDPFYCGTLTADELTLYMARDGQIYVSSRNNRAAPFGKPELVKEIDPGWSFGPGISPDGRELVVTTTLKNGKDEVNVIFEKDAAGTFRQKDVLPSPKGMNAGPAQFSKDGLSIYFSIEPEDNKIEKLYRFHRNRVGDHFVDMEALPEEWNIHDQCLQPTVNADESILIYVISNGSWEEDDIVELRIANPKDLLQRKESNWRIAPGEVGVLQKIVTAGTKVYPNPFRQQVVLELNMDPGNNTRFYLYDLGGREVRQERITGRKTEISLQEMIPGVYVFRVMNAAGEIVSSGKLVRN